MMGYSRLRGCPEKEENVFLNTHAQTQVSRITTAGLGDGSAGKVSVIPAGGTEFGASESM